MIHALQLLSIRPKIWRNWIKRFNVEHIISITIVILLLFLFWLGAYSIFHIILAYLNNIPPIGTILISRLLSLIFLALFLMTGFSDIITALSIMYLSRDLGLLHQHPIRPLSIFLDKFMQTIFYGSWAVIFFGIPLYFAYGRVFHAGWYFYPIAILSNVPFLVISAGLAVLVTLLVAYFVPANRGRTITIILIAFAFISVALYLRFLQTGRMLGVSKPTVDLSSYLFNLRLSSTPYLPNQWVTQIFQAAAQRNFSELIFYSLLLLSTAALVVQLCIELAGRVYHAGWIKAGEAVSYRYKVQGTRYKISSFFLRSLSWIPLPLPIRSLAVKDIKIFWRDLTQWGQLTLLVTLVLVYLFNTRSFILSGGFGRLDYFWRQFIGLLNLGLIGFVLGNLAIRFVYPLISLEGRIIWLIQSSPMRLSTFFWVKYWLALTAILVIGLGLTGISIYLLHLDLFVAGLSLITIISLSIGMTSLAMGLGAIYPTFNVENPMQLTTGIGAVLITILGMLYIGITLTIVAYPLHAYFISGAHADMLSLGTILPACCLFLLTGLTTILLVKLGLNRLQQRSK